MPPTALVFGCGDVGLKIADGLLRQDAVSRLVLADVNADRAGAHAAMLDCCHEAHVEFYQSDGRDPREIEAVIRKAKPDLIIQTASLISPWWIIGRDHPTARALNAAGIGIQLPVQFPIAMNLMRVVRDMGLAIPVANMTMPDFIHPILATRGLEPTIGLGNVSILHLRARAALKRRRPPEEQELPLLRVVGHHKQVYDVMQAKPPNDSENSPWVFVGEEASRDESLAFEGEPFAPGPIYNVITAAAALPVLSALLPDAQPLRYSAPAPAGLPGGYPVRIENGSVTLDLPDSILLDDAKAYNQRIGTMDGIARITPDGTVEFSAQAGEAVRGIDESLSQPLNPWDMAERTEKLLEHIMGMGPL